MLVEILQGNASLNCVIINSDFINITIFTSAIEEKKDL
jgi:hypothetical protein